MRAQACAVELWVGLLHKDAGVELMRKRKAAKRHWRRVGVVIATPEGAYVQGVSRALCLICVALTPHEHCKVGNNSVQKPKRLTIF